MSTGTNEARERYVIYARGVLSDSADIYLDDFSVEINGEEIIMTGSVIDHADLMGLMDRLNLLGLKIDSLRRIDLPSKHETHINSD